MNDEWSHLSVYFMQPGFSKQRINIFNEQLKKFKATVCADVTPQTSHVLINGKETSKFGTIWSSKLSQLTSSLDDDVIDNLCVVDSDWLSKCLVQQKVIDCKPYIVELSTKNDHPQLESELLF